MPGYLGGDNPVLGVKLLGVFGGNSNLGKDAHQGVVLLLDPATGEARAVVNASAITAVRTAAVSAVATDVLARPDASVLTVIGTGVTAQWHVRALLHVRAISAVRLVGRVSSAWAGRGGRARHRVAGADLVHQRLRRRLWTVPTSWSRRRRRRRRCSSAPGWRRAYTSMPWAHAFPPRARSTLRRCRTRPCFVDRRESALAEAGDLILAGLGADGISAELGEVCAGARPGRTDPAEMTLFESLGLAVEDLAAAAHVVAAAPRTGHGTWAEF